MFCIKCGTQLPDGSNFCPNCAAPVVGGNNVNRSGQNESNPYLAPPPSHSANSYNAGSTGAGNSYGNTTPALSVDVGAELRKYYGVLIIPIAYFVITIILNVLKRNVDSFSAYNTLSYISTFIYVLMLGGMVVATKSCGKSIKFFYAIPYVLLTLFPFVKELISYFRYIRWYMFIETIANIAVLAIVIAITIIMQQVKLTDNVMLDTAIIGAISGLVALIFRWIVILVVEGLAFGFEFFYPNLLTIIITIVGAAAGAILNSVISTSTVKQ